MAELDDNQREAVDAGPIDLFVSAGAGSGKTRVLAARFVAAVTGAPPYPVTQPDQVLTITFTEKAAAELSERIRRGLLSAGRSGEARGIDEAWISTIHGMCARVLHRYAFEASIDPHFSVLDETAAHALILDAFEESAASMIADDEGVRELLDRYGYAEVSAAVRRAGDAARALGQSVSAIVVHDAGAAWERARACAVAMAHLADGFRSLPACKTAEASARVADTLAAAMRALGPGPDAGQAEAVIEQLAQARFVRRSAPDGHAELVDEARGVVTEALSCLRQMAVAPFERAFLRLAGAFAERYDALKKARATLDYEDLQLETAALLERRPDVADELADHFAMLMVDEFQDTNALQLRVIDRIARGDLCTVGDENQSIYRFRHADVGVFRARAAAVTAHAALDANYRTAPALLRAVNGVFSHEALLGPGFMHLRAPEPPAPRGAWPANRERFQMRVVDDSVRVDCDRKQAEADAIAAHVAELVDEGVQPSDIAVLLGAVRGGTGAAVEQALAQRDIPAVLASGGVFWKCQEIAQMRALLRLVDNVRDDEAAVSVLAGPITGLSSDALFAVREAAPRAADGRRPPLWSGALAVADAIADPDRGLLARTTSAVAWARRYRGTLPLGALVRELALRLEVDLVLMSRGPGGARAWGNVLKLSRMADEYEAATGGDLRGFLEHLVLREAATASEEEATLAAEGDAVRIMSIHASKGLEFPAVVLGAIDRASSGAGRIITGREDGRLMLGMRLPEADAADADTIGYADVRATDARAAYEESARLLYVACTRAREHLAVVFLTDPEKDAGDPPSGRLRQALGMAEGGSVQPGIRPVGEGEAEVLLVAPVVRADDGPAGPPTASAPQVVPEPLLAQPKDAGVRMPARVSYTALTEHRACPFKFYLQRLARLHPPATAATGPGAMVFGSLVHTVLERCGDDASRADEQVDRVVASEGLDPVEVHRLRAAVQAYLGSETAALVASADRVAREVPITVPLGPVVLDGAIDVLAWFGDEALIVDYKTGERPLTLEQAREEFELQGLCYALATLAAGARSVRVVFAELERGRTTEYTYEEADKAAIEETVSRPVVAMAAGRYAPLPAYVRDTCETCPGLGGLCPVTRPRDGAAG